jgi:hypothetical protein
MQPKTDKRKEEEAIIAIICFLGAILTVILSIIF